MTRWLTFIILFLAPHIQFPGMADAYPFRPVDAVIMVSAALAIYSSKHYKVSGAKVVYAALIYFFLSVASAVWGFYYLSSLHLDTITVSDSSMSYLTVTIRTISLLLVCFLGFHLLAYSRQIDNKTLLKYWFFGVTFAVVIHIVTYAIAGDSVISRAGVFREGNFGGSYYVLSFFLMWIAARESYHFGIFGMLLSVIGIFCSQSTSAIVIFALLGISALIVSPRSNNHRRFWGIGSFAAVAIVGVLATLFFGETITDKLLGEELTNNSFSRYDRLSSIISGLSMFQTSPLVGVGIQGYAFALPNHIEEFIANYFDWNSRRIANNIYVELLAEQGVVGLAAMGYLLYQVMLPAFRSSSRDVLASFGFISILASWLAFPSYTVSYHWLGFALLYRISRSNSRRKISSSPAHSEVARQNRTGR